MLETLCPRQYLKSLPGAELLHCGNATAMSLALRQRVLYLRTERGSEGRSDAIHLPVHLRVCDSREASRKILGALREKEDFGQAERTFGV